MDLFVRELTPPGAGAVSVLELRGAGALDAVQELARPALIERGQLRVLRLSDAGEDLDEAICLALDTDRVELHLHGSPVLLERVVRALGGVGARAMVCGALEEEARGLLGEARGEAAARILLDQSEGALSRRLEELALMEEEEAREGLRELSREAEELAHVLSPPRVVLAGPTNSGKSTLFNALMGSERVITSSLPGTTRDLVIGCASLDGLDYELVDTAGEREVQDGAGPGAIEREGQRTAKALREGAQVVLWLERAGDARLEAPVGCELIETHSDRLSDPPAGAISALSDPKGAREEVSRRLRGALQLARPRWSEGRGVLFSPSLRVWAAEVIADPIPNTRTRLSERIGKKVAL